MVCRSERFNQTVPSRDKKRGLRRGKGELFRPPSAQVEWCAGVSALIRLSPAGTRNGGCGEGRVSYPPPSAQVEWCAGVSAFIRLSPAGTRNGGCGEGRVSYPPALRRPAHRFLSAGADESRPNRSRRSALARLLLCCQPNHHQIYPRCSSTPIGGRASKLGAGETGPLERIPAKTSSEVCNCHCAGSTA